MFVSLTQLTHRYCKYVEKDPIQSMRDVTPRMIGAFFDWVLNQRRGKGGRRLKGIKTESSLISYYKNFRMACEKATGIRIGEGDIVFKRMVNRVSHTSTLLCPISPHEEGLQSNV